MPQSRQDQPLAIELREAVRRYRRIALFFAVVCGLGVLWGVAGPQDSQARWIRVWALGALWAGLTALCFLLVANAFAEDAPIRWFVRRVAFFCAALPLILWLDFRLPDGVDSVVLVGLIVVVFGWNALRHVVF
jgi:hypothetical protein